MIRFKPIVFLIAFATVLASLKAQHPSDMAVVPGGLYVPFVKESGQVVKVKAFYMDIKAVTNHDFETFVKQNPQWSKETIKALFADENYLKQRKTDNNKNNPVTNVSWFAANAYCKSKGKRLPTTAEWEHAAAAPPLGNTYQNTHEIIMLWYSRKMPKQADVGSVYQNSFGLYDMFGLIWEWVDDFDNSAGGSSRDGGTNIPEGLFCGGGSLGVANASDYATFIRYAFRGAQKANFTSQKLGFRCAKNI